MENIKIQIEEFDQYHHIVYISNMVGNLWAILSLFEFEDDMEYFGFSTHMVENNGGKGYVFDKKIDTELLISEINRFCEDHDLKKYNPI